MVFRVERTREKLEANVSSAGRTVHASSRLAFSPIPTGTFSAASKATVIETDMTTAIIAERGDQTRATIPLCRIGQPDDIAGIVVFPVSDDSHWITGRTLLADGGLICAGQATQCRRWRPVDGPHAMPMCEFGNSAADQSGQDFEGWA